MEHTICKYAKYFHLPSCIYSVHEYTGYTDIWEVSVLLYELYLVAREKFFSLKPPSLLEKLHIQSKKQAQRKKTKKKINQGTMFFPNILHKNDESQAAYLRVSCDYSLSVILVKLLAAKLSTFYFVPKIKFLYFRLQIRRFWKRQVLSFYLSVAVTIFNCTPYSLHDLYICDILK